MDLASQDHLYEKNAKLRTIDASAERAMEEIFEWSHSTSFYETTGPLL